MSMLEKDLQEVDLDAAEEALDDTDDDVTVEEDAFEKALGREDRQSTQSFDATQIYLNEIGFSPLLTPEEEVYY
ncbi:MAG TPA: sigma-70 factor domain-containing protein, partial [Halomonas sp.]|nr:sigma-70 factor domain-containing protein [Halomonas sp.]